MDFSIIICTYNRSNTLKEVLENIQGLNGHPDIIWETLVVDNNSTDGTKEVVESSVLSNQTSIKYLFEGRQGKSFALNAGIKAAQGKVLAFTDDDVIINPDWLVNMKAAFIRYGCAGIGGRIIPVFPAKTPSWLKVNTSTPFMNTLGSFDRGEECCELKGPPFGANMAFRREVFAEHGLFRTDLGPTMENSMGKGEDSEFSLRLLSRGERLIYAPDVIIYHRVQEENMRKSFFQTWYFNYGRFVARTSGGIPQNTICYAGVPRYLFRMLSGKLLHWFFSFKAGQRMGWKLEYFEILGRIVEYFTARRLRRPNP